MLSFDGHVMMYGGSEGWGGVSFHALVYYRCKLAHIMICEVTRVVMQRVTQNPMLVSLPTRFARLMLAVRSLFSSYLHCFPNPKTTLIPLMRSMRRCGITTKCVIDLPYGPRGLQWSTIVLGPAKELDRETQPKSRSRAS